MGSVNKAILVGNLGRDAELRYTSGGAPVASVRIATTERFTDKEGQKREDTQWHDVVIWGKTAEALHEYLVKGKQIYVEGRIQTKEWTDKEGQKVKTTEIRADRVVLLGGGGDGGEGRARPAEVALRRRARAGRRDGARRRAKRRRHPVLRTLVKLEFEV
jgi:single-strand DNA-binding protein